MKQYTPIPYPMEEGAFLPAFQTSQVLQSGPDGNLVAAVMDYVDMSDGAWQFQTGDWF